VNREAVGYSYWVAWINYQERHSLSEQRTCSGIGRNRYFLVPWIRGAHRDLPQDYGMRRRQLCSYAVVQACRCCVWLLTVRSSLFGAKKSQDAIMLMGNPGRLTGAETP
jgi:hypothetical protein